MAKEEAQTVAREAQTEAQARREAGQSQCRLVPSLQPPLFHEARDSLLYAAPSPSPWYHYPFTALHLTSHYSVQSIARHANPQFAAE
jgi:hypothetical protein